MREIKFRAWDGRHDEWIVNDYFISLANGQIYEGRPAHPKIILEQFTGLKDRDGKEIYEGDILQIFGKHYAVSIVQHGGRVEVEYGYGSDHNGPAPHWVEVVGNIHENPELLKI